MASEEEVKNAVTDYAALKGFACGQDAFAVSEVARAIQGMVIGETQSSLEKKIGRLATTPGSGLEKRGDTIAVSALPVPSGQ